MAFNSLIRRASSLLGLSNQDVSRAGRTETGEVIFCKNNVCVHPPVPLRTEAEHNPGYLTIRSQHDESSGSTLILTWIPNSSLKRNPRSLENRTPTHSPCRSSRSSACPSPVRRSPRHSLPFIHSNGASMLHLCANEQTTEEANDDYNQPSKWSLPFVVGSGGDNNSAARRPTSAEIRLTSTDHTESTSPPDSLNAGVGPEEVSRALHSMISELNEESGSTAETTPTTTTAVSKPKALSDGHHIVTDHWPPNGIIGLPRLSENDDTDEVSRRSDVSGEQVATVNSGTTSPPRKRDLKIELTLDLSESSTNLCSTATNNAAAMPDISVTRYLDAGSGAGGDASSGTSTTSNCDPDSVPVSPTTGCGAGDGVGCGRGGFGVPGSPFLSHLASYYMEGTPESLAASLARNFPDQYLGCAATQPNTPSHKPAQACGFFSVDLGKMKSLRLFFSNKECTCGQLVVASCESQYKILHFHCGGLERLAGVLEDWDIFIKSKNKNDNCPYQQFSIFRPEVSKEECHPDEGLEGLVDDNVWRSFLNEDGQIEEDFHLRKLIFFGGLDNNIRHEAWPFLLHYYPFMSTFDEREQIRNDAYLQYQAVRKKRETMSVEEKEEFWRNIQCTVEKDVVRTDRSNPFFRGDDNPNLELMRNILLNYAVYNPTMGYTQGMSDLLAPILTEVQHESDSFWCFVGLMQRTIFISSPKDNDMDKHLNFIRELIRLMVPKFYEHFLVYIDAMELLFCHRWILLCFKREFLDTDAMRMWEACWAHYQTDYFHLFICVAIIAIYGKDVIQQNMNADEMLLYFSSLSMHMSGDMVLRKARGLLYHFRQMQKIPCTLKGLCDMCGPGMWDSGHFPSIECVKSSGYITCPSGGECPAS